MRGHLSVLSWLYSLILILIRGFWHKPCCMFLSPHYINAITHYELPNMNTNYVQLLLHWPFDIIITMTLIGNNTLRKIVTLLLVLARLHLMWIGEWCWKPVFLSFVLSFYSMDKVLHLNFDRIKEYGERRRWRVRNDMWCLAKK